MALVAPDASEILLLKYIVGLTASGHPVLHLFSNNVLILKKNGAWYSPVRTRLRYC